MVFTKRWSIFVSISILGIAYAWQISFNNAPFYKHAWSLCNPLHVIVTYSILIQVIMSIIFIVIHYRS